jgi:DnaJ like chaperone protein
MHHLSLNEADKLQAMRMFNQGKSTHFNFMACLLQVRQAIPKRSGLRLLLVETLLEFVYVDGLHPTKEQLVNQIANQLEIPLHIFQRRQSRFHSEKKFQEPKQRTENELENAFGVLGVPYSASFQEVKKAYRKLMSMHHPDKLAAKGLPESMRKMANEKTQNIQRAYELICQKKGWS